MTGLFANTDRSRGLAGQRNLVQVIAEFVVVGICTLAFAFTTLNIGTSLFVKGAAGARDFVSYWAVGQQLVNRRNPYDEEAIPRIERSVGLPAGASAVLMRNPPTALPLMFPLGFMSATFAMFLWTSILLVCLVVSVRTIWRIHGSPKGPGYLFGYGFAPALVCLGVGQVGLLILLGMALFLRFYQSRPILAGGSLWLCALKPHLFLPFGVVLLAWIIATRSYRILAGAASALVFSAAIAWILDPLAWLHYSQMVTAEQIDRSAMPCLCSVLRRSIAPNAIWLQYLPAMLGCVWALDYFRRNRRDRDRDWDWTVRSSPLLLVSILVAPYTWFTDQAILLPAILHAVSVTRSRGLLVALALASVVIEIGPVRGWPVLQSQFYLWTTPAWLAWYLFATRAGASAGPIDSVPFRADVPRGSALDLLPGRSPYAGRAAMDEVLR